MKNTKISLSISILFIAFAMMNIVATSCHDHDDSVPETITKVAFELTYPDGSQTFYSWEDADGDGGNAPTLPTFNLKRNQAIECNIRVFDGSTEITSEISEESNEHLWEFEVFGTSNLNATITDKDTNNKPLGLKSTWTTTDFGSGTIRITLLHEPNKDNATDPGGETDFTADFPFTIAN
jgi:hypothetical protein